MPSVHGTPNGIVARRDGCRRARPRSSSAMSSSSAIRSSSRGVVMRSPKSGQGWVSRYRPGIERAYTRRHGGRLAEANRELWDERVPIHVASELYDVEAFVAGRSSLRAFELAELHGRPRAHARPPAVPLRRGHALVGAGSGPRSPASTSPAPRSPPRARSPRAAGSRRSSSRPTSSTPPRRSAGGASRSSTRASARSTGCPTSSAGPTSWRRSQRPADASTWPSSIRSRTSSADDDLTVEYPYFHAEPFDFPTSGTYADPEARTVHNRSYEWNHGVGAVVSALIGAGFELEFLHEHDHTLFARWPFLVGERGAFRMPEGRPSLPLLYSLRARRRGLASRCRTGSRSRSSRSCRAPRRSRSAGPRCPLVAVALALAAAGEEVSLWHASWILGEGWLGRSVGAVAGTLFALPALALGLAIRARRPSARRRAL